MPARLELPDGYTARHFTLSDAPAVVDLMAAAEKHDVGEVMIELADIVSDWSTSTYSFEDSVGVYAGTTLVGYTERTGPTRGDGQVHPDHRGKGLGTALSAWLVQRAAEHGDTSIGIPFPEGSPGDRLQEARGWPVRWHSWVLELPAGARITPRPLPAGYAVRAADASEYEAAWHVTEDAFLEWADRVKQPFEDWSLDVQFREGFEPWMLRVVLDPAGDVVGVAHIVLADEGREGYVSRLGVRIDRRNRGLAQALLADAFTASREHGAVKSSLSTDSRTGALSLYEKVGMVVTSTWINRGITL
ncbi:GNAT family N-acetyltransferase [Microbacterium sp.]|uniref:GNAT family N-acetyltransferase n=1 Tax=Microbacterium sp. TaxID=51671 RepID=UPI003C73EB06